MNNKIKKGIYLVTSLGIVGGISASIVLPIVNKQASLNNSLDWKPGDDFITGGVNPISGSDFLENVTSTVESDDNTLSQAEYSAAFMLYEKEQIGSIDFQESYLQWDVVQTVKEIHALRKANSDQDDWYDEVVKKRDAITNSLTLLKSIQDHKDFLADPEKGEELDFDSSRFSTDYNKILLPLEQVREKQEKTFSDYKDNFIKSYTTRDEGLKNWPAERTSRYNGANTDNDAIDYLVHAQISSNATAQFRFKLNSEFTIGQKEQSWPISYFSEGFSSDGIYELPEIGQVEDDEDFETELTDWINPKDEHSTSVFSWIQNAVEKDYSDPQFGTKEEDDLVYFYSSESRIPENIEFKYDKNAINDPSKTNQVIKNITDNNKLMEVSHALFTIKPSEEGHLQPWSVDKETLKSLYSFYGPTDKRAYDLLHDGTDQLLFGDTDEAKDATDLLIRFFSNNSEGTKFVQGKLGIMPATEYVTSMVGGFGTGILKVFDMIEKEAAGVTPGNGGFDDIRQDNMIKAFRDKLAELELDANGALGWNEKPNDQTDLVQKIDALSDDKVSEVFGGAMRELFDPEYSVIANQGIDLVYGSDTRDVYVVVSEEHGLHFINIDKYYGTGTSHIENLIDAVSEDLQSVANEQDIAEATTDFAALFQSYFDTNTQLKFIIDANETADGGNTFKDFLLDEDTGDKEYWETEVDGLSRWEILNTTINRAISSGINNEASETVTSKLDWYIGTIEERSRDIEQLNPEDIYRIAFEMAGGSDV